LNQRADWLVDAVPQLIRFGADTNWQKVINGPNRSFILLRRDGTLWHWGTNDWSDRQIWPGLKAFTPSQIGRDSDWARIVPGPGGTLAWKKDGTAWDFRIRHRPEPNRVVFTAPQLLPERCSYLDHAEWLAFSDGPAWDCTGLRADGTLWIWQLEIPDPKTYQMVHVASPKLIQLGNDNDWAMLGSGWGSLAALKKDGTLWRWPRFVNYHTRLESILGSKPRRLGSHSDWVGIAGLYDGSVSLAADGSLWFWSDRNDYEFAQPMLGPSRKPIFIENIFAANSSEFH
jgi:alpha-tubulin suppressor-like RCC1 family protein